MRLMNFPGQFFLLIAHIIVQLSGVKMKGKTREKCNMRARGRKNLATLVSQDDVTRSTSISREQHDTHQMKACWDVSLPMFYENLSLLLQTRIASILCDNIFACIKFSNTMRHQMDLFSRKMKRDERRKIRKGFRKIIQMLVAGISV